MKKIQNGGPKFRAQKWHQFLGPANTFFFLGDRNPGQKLAPKVVPQKTKKNKAKTPKKILKNVPGVAGGGGQSRGPSPVPGRYVFNCNLIRKQFILRAR